MELVALTGAEQTSLTELESTIERNLQSFYEIGMALMKIRDGRLYRGDYDTFEDYCRDRWKFSKRYANDLVASTKVIENLSGNHGSQIPTSERQVRPLTKLPPEKQPEAWDNAVKSAPEGKVTAKHVERAVDEMRGMPREVRDIFKPERYSCARNFSRVAIEQLKGIPLDDPDRREALEEVITWCEDNM